MVPMTWLASGDTSAAGNLHFGPLPEMSAEQFNVGLQDKLLGQVRLALLGQRFLNDGGSITLTAGVLAIEPIRNGANATAVNAALEAFASAAVGKGTEPDDGEERGAREVERHAGEGAVRRSGQHVDREEGGCSAQSIGDRHRHARVAGVRRLERNEP